jgi:hypothetical protein
VRASELVAQIMAQVVLHGDLPVCATWENTFRDIQVFRGKPGLVEKCGYDTTKEGSVILLDADVDFGRRTPYYGTYRAEQEHPDDLPAVIPEPPEDEY